MLKNYLKVAFRNLWRRKSFFLLNITGLSLGMASAIMIFLWIANEISYDRFHKNGYQIYQVWNRETFEGKIEAWNYSPMILAPTMQQEYPEVEQFARVAERSTVTAAGEKRISSKGIIADPSFLIMFSFPMEQGSIQNALTPIHSIIITENMAKKMFGTGEAMSQLITIDSVGYTVTGILKNLPSNTSFDFEFILPWSYFIEKGLENRNWGNHSIRSYIQVKPNTDIIAFSEKIKDLAVRHSKGKEENQVFLHPLSQLHLYSRFENGQVAGGRIETVRLFIIIAIFLLVIASINFMNLTTAQSERRAKEVGIRKVAGANKGLLIGQFLGESMLISLISGLVALALVELALPLFTPLVNTVLHVPYESLNFWLIGAAFIVVTGFIAGSYPAFFLSRFNPVAVLKGTIVNKRAALSPQKVLVVLQFSFAIILMISTFVILQQIRFGQQRETGFDRNRLVYHWMSGELSHTYDLLKNELLASGAVAHVTKTSSPLTSGSGATWSVEWRGKTPDAKIEFDLFAQDEGLVKTAGLQLLQGRDIDLNQFPTDSSAVVLNESAATVMGFEQPIGQVITENGMPFHVVGVIKDFVLGSPFDRTKPMLIEGSKKNLFSVINMRLADNKSTAETMSAISGLFKKYNPAYPFEYYFADEQHAQKFAETERTATLTGLFAILTIFISCLGLFALATYMAKARVKEISVRKVLGASVMSITGLLSTEFLQLVGISILIATPVAWYAMNSWLESYAYRTQLHWWVFAIAGVLAIIISLTTIGYQCIRAAMADPAKSLRSE